MILRPDVVQGRAEVTADGTHDAVEPLDVRPRRRQRLSLGLAVGLGLRHRRVEELVDEGPLGQLDPGQLLGVGLGLRRVLPDLGEALDELQGGALQTAVLAGAGDGRGGQDPLQLMLETSRLQRLIRLVGGLPVLRGDQVQDAAVAAGLRLAVDHGGLRPPGGFNPECSGGRLSDVAYPFIRGSSIMICIIALT